MRQLSIKQRESTINEKRGKRDIIIIRSGLFPSTKIKSKNWQNLNESQKQYKSKQIIKSLYGKLSQKELILTSKKSKGFANVISKLETRLDVLVYRLQFVYSLAEAREFIKKGFITVNGTVVLFPGFFVSNGSCIVSSNVNSAFIRISYRKKGLSMPNYLYHTGYLSGVLLEVPRNIIPLTESPLTPHYRHFNESVRPFHS